MKLKLVLPLLSLFLVMTCCRKEEVVLPGELLLAKAEISEQFETMNQQVKAVISYALSVDLDTALIRVKLKELTVGFPDFATFSWVTPSGILQVIEPAVYKGSEGADISLQAHVIKSFSTKQPVLSNVFFAVESAFASVVIHPVIKDNTIAGAITTMFYPELVLGNIMLPICEGEEFELWAMQKGGRILYDQDVSEIGLELFSDPLYADYPELITAGHKIDEEDCGKTFYSFLKTGTLEEVTKLTYWTTFRLYGNEWKLVWVKPE